MQSSDCSYKCLQGPLYIRQQNRDQADQQMRVISDEEEVTSVFLIRSRTHKHVTQHRLGHVTNVTTGRNSVHAELNARVRRQEKEAERRTVRKNEEKTPGARTLVLISVSSHF